MGKLLDYLVERDLSEWKIPTNGKVHHYHNDLHGCEINYTGVFQEDGRYVYISAYPDEPEIVTFEVWSKRKEELKHKRTIEDLTELLYETDDVCLDYYQAEDIAELLVRAGYGKISD